MIHLTPCSDFGLILAILRAAPKWLTPHLVGNSAIRQATPKESISHLIANLAILQAAPKGSTSHCVANLVLRQATPQRVHFISSCQFGHTASSTQNTPLHILLPARPYCKQRPNWSTSHFAAKLAIPNMPEQLAGIFRWPSQWVQTVDMIFGPTFGSVI